MMLKGWREPRYRGGRRQRARRHKKRMLRNRAMLMIARAFLPGATAPTRQWMFLGQSQA